MKSSLAEAVIAMVAGAVATAVVYPIDLLKTVVQNVDSKGLNNEFLGLNAIKRIYNSDGLLGFYRGFATKAFQHCYEDMLYFFAYDIMREYFLSFFAKLLTKTELPLMVNMTSGSLAGAVQFLITTPIEVISTSVQVSKQTVLEVVENVYDRKGIFGFWEGYTISCILTINPAINFSVLEKLKYHFLKNEDELSSTEAFSIAMIAKMIAITIVYPLIRLKILSQSMVGSKSMGFQRAMEMIQKHGIVSLYQGLLYQLARSMLAAGVMFATQEHLRNILKRMHDVPKTPAHYIEEDA